MERGYLAPLAMLLYRWAGDDSYIALFTPADTIPHAWSRPVTRKDRT